MKGIVDSGDVLLFLGHRESAVIDEFRIPRCEIGRFAAGHKNWSCCHLTPHFLI